MSSQHRSSSGVRNLRSLFENKAASIESDTPGSRGRSPSGISVSDKENGYPRASKVRASFISVEPPKMAAAVDGVGRRGSFGEEDGDLDLKKMISDQQESLDVPEAAVESAEASLAVTPLGKADEVQLGNEGSVWADELEEVPSNSDKPVTVAEEEPEEIKAADPADEDAVSGAQALPPVTEDLKTSAEPTASVSAEKPEVKSSTTNGKPAAISTMAPAKSAPSSEKTPVSAKTPSSNVSPDESTIKAPLSRPSRSSLTAPTAASLARSGAAADKSAISKTSPASKPKPREVTKPVNLPSYLTAPTASSRARHEPEAASPPTSNTFRASTTSRPKPQVLAKPTPRSSLAAQQRPGSRDSQKPGRRSLVPPDGSFLDRMMRPTAASSGKTTHKVESKSPTRPTPTAAKPKVNGSAAKTTAPPAPEPSELASVEEPTQDEALPDEPGFDAEPSGEEQSGLTLAGNASTGEVPITSAKEDTHPISGIETPISHPQTNGGAEAEALEATPAGMGGDETIR